MFGVGPIVLAISIALYYTELDSPTDVEESGEEFDPQKAWEGGVEELEGSCAKIVS